MLVYLNGTSSSGKSSLAEALQNILPVPAIYFSVDVLLHGLSAAYLEAIQGKRPYPSPLDWAPIFAGYFNAVAGLVRAGNFVIADCPVYSAESAAAWKAALAPLEKKLVVGLHCPLEILEAREQARGDRAIGLARKQFAGIHQFLKYDLEADSAARPAREIAGEIVTRVH